MAKEAKTVNFGLTEEAMKYLEEMQKKYGEKDEEDEEKSENKKKQKEIVRATLSVIEAEIQKIAEKLNDRKIEVGSEEWEQLIRGLDRATNVIRYF